MVIDDHINLQPHNPLTGENYAQLGPRFPDMSQPYNKMLNEKIEMIAAEMNLPLHKGVYVAVQGPTYETPAEIIAFRTMGADLVGMSTVPEVIAARHSGLRVLGISCVTNMAAGITDAPLHHLEVLETTARVKNQFIALLRAVIPKIAEAIA